MEQADEKDDVEGERRWHSRLDLEEQCLLHDLSGNGVEEIPK